MGKRDDVDPLSEGAKLWNIDISPSSRTLVVTVAETVYEFRISELGELSFVRQVEKLNENDLGYEVLRPFDETVVGIRVDTDPRTQTVQIVCETNENVLRYHLVTELVGWLLSQEEQKATIAARRALLAAGIGAASPR